MDETQKQASWNAALLEALTTVQTRFFSSNNVREAFDIMLSSLLELAESEYGFIGEVLQKDGYPYLKTYAISNIAWDDATRAFYAENAPNGMEFYNLNTLFGSVMMTESVVIANSPGADPRRGGLPKGHPPLDAFLGMPLQLGDRMVGMVGLANRKAGYDDAIVERLNPFWLAAATLISESAARRERVAAMEAVDQQRNKLHAVFASMLDGLIIINYRGTIEDLNQAACDQIGYEREELIGENVKKLMPAADAEQHDHYIRRYLSTGEARIIGSRRAVEVCRKDGTQFPAFLSLSEFSQQGRRYFTGTLQDATLQKEYEARLTEANDALLEANGKLERLARTDELTGLENRRSFDECLEREFRRASRDALPLSLIIWDVDLFKHCNDRHGHPVGDSVLREIAKAAGGVFRRAGDRVFRYGGDEFVAVLSSTGEEAALELAAELKDRVRAIVIPDVALDSPLTLSCGVATCVKFDSSKQGGHELLQAADHQLLAAKRAGRDRAVSVSISPRRGVD